MGSCLCRDKAASVPNSNVDPMGNPVQMATNSSSSAIMAPGNMSPNAAMETVRLQDIEGGGGGGNLSQVPTVWALRHQLRQQGTISEHSDYYEWPDPHYIPKELVTRDLIDDLVLTTLRVIRTLVDK